MVQLTKVHLVRFRIPDRLFTDNGPQFISTEYKQFVSDYGFEHVTSSSYWSQGNGKAEATAKIEKECMKRTMTFIWLFWITETPLRKDRSTLFHKGSSPKAQGVYFQWHEPEVLRPVAFKTEIGARRT